jgi:hypothetical protein
MHVTSVTACTLDAAVCRISSFYMTLLLFAGQVFAGIATGTVFTGSFSLNNLLGGVCITAGLAQNLWPTKGASAHLARTHNFKFNYTSVFS